MNRTALLTRRVRTFALGLSIIGAGLPPLARAASSGDAGSPSDLVGDLTSAKRQAELLNAGVGGLKPGSSAADFLKALKIKFKVFEATADNSTAALGFEYDFSKAVTEAQVFKSANPGFLSFTVKAKGNVAFAADRNPADFLQSSGQFHLWQYSGQTDVEATGADGKTVSTRTNSELASDKYRGKTIAEIKALPIWQHYVQHAFDDNPDEKFIDVVGSGGLESNQSFSKKQWAYGVELHGSYRAWKADSAWGKFNVLDWPFALTRALGDEPVLASGRYLPSIMIGADYIDPAKNTDRLKIDPSKDKYHRVKTEIGFRTKAIAIDRKTIWFSASYRYFREVSPSAAIRTAKMDRAEYFAASLELPGNYLVTYSTGKLPFDLKSQQVWSIGFKLNH